VTRTLHLTSELISCGPQLANRAFDITLSLGLSAGTAAYVGCAATVDLRALRAHLTKC